MRGSAAGWDRAWPSVSYINVLGLKGMDIGIAAIL